MKYFRRVVSGAKEDAEKVFRPDFCALRGSDSGAGRGGALVLLLPVNRVQKKTSILIYLVPLKKIIAICCPAFWPAAGGKFWHFLELVTLGNSDF